GILLLYTLVVLGMLVYSVFAHNSYIYLKLRDYVEFKWRIAAESVLLAMMFALLLAVFALGYSTQLMWHEYQFIAEVDEFLKTTRRPSSNENNSHDNNSGNHVHPSHRKFTQPLVIV
uniref:MARVEL domain-containing protein n=1 Tax=Steinernema glaseri TaxID=37863 RepID=A0A1I8AQE2_9BILA